MLLKPKNLEEMTAQLRELPADRRRVIILAGRHLNEGTRTLAVRHHKEWEKHGAVAIGMPPYWTPHGFYHKLMQTIHKGLPGLSMFSPGPDDSKVIRHLAESGFDVPVVNFHGTPKAGYGGYVMYEIHPTESRVILPENWRLFESGKNMQEKYPEARFVYDSNSTDPQEVLVEYHYEPASESQNKQTLTRNVRKTIEENPVFVMPSTQINLEYLTHPGISRAALKTFEEQHHERFLELLAGLSRNGLGKNGGKHP